MNKFKNVVAVAGVVLTIMTGLCNVISNGMESVEKIKRIG